MNANLSVAGVDCFHFFREITAVDEVVKLQLARARDFIEKFFEYLKLVRSFEVVCGERPSCAHTTNQVHQRESTFQRWSAMLVRAADEVLNQ